MFADGDPETGGEEAQSQSDEGEARELEGDYSDSMKEITFSGIWGVWGGGEARECVKVLTDEDGHEGGGTACEGGGEDGGKEEEASFAGRKGGEEETD